MQFYDCCGKVYDVKNDCGAKFASDKNLIKSFREAMRGNQPSAASQLISTLTQCVRNFRSSEIENVKNLYFRLLMVVFETARERDLIGEAEENEQCYIWQEIERIRFLSELSDYLQNNMKATLSQAGPDGTENRKIFEINRYIRESISDKRLSVQTVAHSIFLNHQYLCSFYKKATGKTVNDYITEVRMEKAKELLLDKKNKIYDVTARIGLTDSNYFSTLFKKYTGYTPSEYRERN
jgi:two-component system response regulator YesN